MKIFPEVAIYFEGNTNDFLAGHYVEWATELQADLAETRVVPTGPKNTLLILWQNHKEQTRNKSPSGRGVYVATTPSSK